MSDSPKLRDECCTLGLETMVVGEPAPPRSRSDLGGVSVSALFDPSLVDLGELQHISSPLADVLIQLTMEGF